MVCRKVSVRASRRSPPDSKVGYRFLLSLVVADKLYIDSSFLTLAFIDRIELWLGALIVTRDVLILLGWLTRFFLSGIRLLPNTIGKMADSSQAVLLLILLLQPGEAIEQPFIWAAAVLTVLSGFAYLKMAIQPPARMRS